MRDISGYTIRQLPENRSLLLIGITSVISVIVTSICLSNGITTVFPHIYYIPIILSSYFYPKKGVLFAAILGLMYLFILFIFIDPTIPILMSAIIRGIIFVSIAGVVSYLSAKQKDAESKTRISEKRFKELFDNISEGVAIYKPTNEGEDFAFLQVNKAGEQLDRLRNEDIVGRNVTELFPDIVRNGLFDALKEVYQNGKPQVFPLAKFNDENIVFWRDNYIYKLPSDEIVVVYSDVTKKKQDEELLKQSQERLEMALDAAEMGCWTWDVSNNTIDLDERFLAVNYISSTFCTADLPLEHIFNSIYPEDVLQLKEGMNTLLNEGSEVITSIYRVKDDNGVLRWIHLIGKIIEADVSGKPLKVTGIVHDISEMRKYQDSLVTVNNKLNLLSSVTRHDILNQVTALFVFSTLLKDQIPPESELNESVDNIETICTTIEKQIKFTKEYQNLGIKIPSWHKLTDILNKSNNILLQYGIEASVQLDDMHIFADSMIYKVFYNLFENSARHGQSVTKIMISYQINETTSECTIIVEDNGAGIPENNKKKIFDKGFGSNTGLGLFLVKEILDITEIGIRETGIPGCGSRFEITVPKNRWRFDKDHIRQFWDTAETNNEHNT